MIEARIQVPARWNIWKVVVAIDGACSLEEASIDIGGDDERTPNESGRSGCSPDEEKGPEESDDVGEDGSVVIPEGCETVTKPRSK